MKKEYTREELIDICESAVVHHTEWQNRDSYSAQKSIASIYEGLTAGLDFIINDNTDEHTIWITFTGPIDFKKLENGRYLEISSLEDYWNDCDPEYETEMFDGYGIDWRDDWCYTYMPTRERLEYVGVGNDWY